MLDITQAVKKRVNKIKLTIIRYIPMPKCASKLIMKSEREWKLKTLNIIKVFPKMHLQLILAWKDSIPRPILVINKDI